MSKQAVKQVKKTSAKSSTAIDPQTRREMIAQRAYLLAEERHFEHGDPIIDWLEAEAEIDRALKKSKSN